MTKTTMAFSAFPLPSRIGEMAGRLARYRRKRGMAATLRFLASRIFRCQVHVVYEAVCAPSGPEIGWGADERLLWLGPGTLDANLTPELREFLGGEEAHESLLGVRQGNILLVVTSRGEFVHRGYILFRTRQKKIVGETADAPLIANCATVPAARGRGLYTRALRAELEYLAGQGYSRAIIETHPSNVASRRGIEKAGFTFGWQASVWILLNWLVIQRIRKNGSGQWRAFTTAAA